MARPPVEPSDIAEAETPEPVDASMARNELASFAHEETMQKSKLGWVGAIWGSKSEKPGNVAAIVLIVLLFFVGHLLLNHEKWADLFSDTLCLLYTSPSPRDKRQSRMPSSA